jgi:Bacterial DNA-binding protein
VAGVIPASRIVVLHRFRGLTPDTGRFHQPRDPLASNVDPVLQAQPGMDPQRRVHAPAGVVDLFDLLDEQQRLSQANPENRNREGCLPLTQAQLVAVVADRAQLSKADAKRALTALDEIVLEELGNAQKVRIGGLVQLTVRVKPAQKKRKGLRDHAADDQHDADDQPRNGV